MYGSREGVFLKIASFFKVFTLGVEDIKFTIYVPFTILMLHAKFGKDLFSSTWQEVENFQLLSTTHDDARIIIAIGHPSNSGYLEFRFAN